MADFTKILAPGVVYFRDNGKPGYTFMASKHSGVYVNYFGHPVYSHDSGSIPFNDMSAEDIIFTAKTLGMGRCDVYRPDLPKPNKEKVKRFWSKMTK